MNETGIRKGTIMNRTTALALLGLSVLMATPSIAQARYRDGMNLYQYVNSSPTNSTDPYGMFDWEKFKKAYKIYSDLNDEGARYARDLMKHYALNDGRDYKMGSRYVHDQRTSWWSGRSYWWHSGVSAGSSLLSPGWRDFMKARPELHETGRRFYRERTLSLCNRSKGLKGRGFTSGEQQFDWDAPHTKLNRLKSMRLTLHGSERIQVTGFWTIHYDDDAECTCRVEYKWVTWYWHDRGDFHGDMATELDAPGDTVKDSEYKAIGMGKPFAITISWIDKRAEWRSRWDGPSGAYRAAEHVAGWPPPGTSATGGGGGR